MVSDACSKVTKNSRALTDKLLSLKDGSDNL